jgi:hypothetical protein
LDWAAVFYGDGWGHVAGLAEFWRVCYAVLAIGVFVLRFHYRQGGDQEENAWY